MKIKTLLILGSLAAALVAGAVTWDSKNYLDNALSELQEVDRDMSKHETRFIELLNRLPARDSEVDAAVKEYMSTSGLGARHKAFENLAAAAHRTVIPKLDAAAAGSRKVLDDLLGALNRRDMTAKSFEPSLRACEAAFASTRGRIARLIGGFPESCAKLQSHE